MKVVVALTRDYQGGYQASCPALPGCAAHGHSRAEAIENIDPLIRGYLASLNRPAPRKLEKVITVRGGQAPLPTPAHP